MIGHDHVSADGNVEFGQRGFSITREHVVNQAWRVNYFAIPRSKRNEIKGRVRKDSVEPRGSAFDHLWYRRTTLISLIFQTITFGRSQVFPCSGGRIGRRNYLRAAGDTPAATVAQQPPAQAEITSIEGTGRAQAPCILSSRRITPTALMSFKNWSPTSISPRKWTTASPLRTTRP